MIPLTLKIKNFLSYGTEVQTIDFAPYHLICLSGKNGHGKSALLDAMTWALWGTARKVLNATRPDQGLLRLGQNQMMVIFDFMLNSMHYRVRREFSIVRGKPYAQLDFGTINSETQKFIPLTEKTIRNTQTIIEQTIGLTFDTFVNSAFIRQGQSNEFSKKSPKERKEILGIILGLNQYDSLRSSALEKIKEINTQIHTLGVLDEKRTLELQNKAEILRQYSVGESQRTHLLKIEQEYIARLDALNQQEKKINDERNQCALMQFELTRYKQHITELKLSVQTLFKQWRTIQSTYKKLPNLHELQEKKYQLFQSIIHHQQQQQEQLLHKEQLLKIQRELYAIEQTHAKQIADHMSQQNITLERMNIDSASIKIQIQHAHKEKEQAEQELKKTIEKIISIQTLLVELNKQQISPAIVTQFEKRKARYQHFITMGNLLRQELTQIRQKTILVQEDDPSCPLCEQNLSQARKRFLKTKFNEHERLLNHQLQRFVRITQKLKQLLIDQNNQIEQSKKVEQTYLNNKIVIEEIKIAENRLRETTQLLFTKISELEQNKIKLDVQIESHKNTINCIQQETAMTLRNNLMYQQLNNELSQCEKQIKQLTVNHEHMIILQKNMENIDQQLSVYKEIEQQYALQNERKQEIQKICIQLKSLYKKEIDQSHQIRMLEEQIKRDTPLQLEKKELLHHLETIRNQKEQLSHELGKLQAQQNNLNALSKEQQVTQEQIHILNAEMHDYQMISHILSKDGIQALLIEDTIPELEYESNQLLSKLTNNQSHLFFECTRDLKSGGSKETLDIKISDASGIRPYELFSGGEAFRIDFALRIALAKLLARRAGTALQTLIIDEGFGSQDEEGLTHIMEALYKIQDDFAKIIIVSHLPFMKEQFPVHFMVEKGAQGSYIRVIEHG